MNDRSNQREPDLILTPINEAEAVFQRFYDPQRSGLAQWSYAAAEACGGSVQQQFIAVYLQWKRGGGQVGRLERAMQIDAAGYDHVIVCASLPDTATLTVRAVVDGRERVLIAAAPGRSMPDEYEAPLPGRQIERMTLEITDRAADPSMAMLFWLGLFSDPRRREMLARPCPYTGDWDGLAVPPGQRVEHVPKLGLFFGAADLPRLRARARSAAYAPLLERLRALARRSLGSRPWLGIARHPNSPKPRCYRFRSEGPIDMLAMRLGGLVGLIDDDESLMRMAIDHALALAHCEYWYPEFAPVIAGSSWEQRSFHEYRWAHNAIFAWDWAGAYLTPAGQQLLAQGVSTKALPWILQTLMRHPYVRGCNQGAYFSWGAIICELALARVYPNATELLDAAVRALDQTVERYFAPDGGAFEGAGYVTATAAHAVAAYWLVARHRNVPLEQVVPARLRQVSQYIRTMVSTTPPYGAVINVADGGRPGVCLYMECLALLSALTGDSELSALMAGMIGQEAFNEVGATPGAAMVLIAGPDTLPAPRAAPPVFHVLEHTGMLCSCRPTPHGPVRVQLIGGPARAGHAHDDRGSIVVEAFGEEILIDRGQMNYGDPRATSLKMARYHNVLIPEAADGELLSRQVNPCPAATIPNGSGDERVLRAGIDVSAAWSPLAERAARHLDSDDPLLLAVVDEADLARPARVSFHLHSRWPWAQQGGAWVTRGQLAELRVEPGWTAEQASAAEDMVDGGLNPVYHLTLVAPPSSRHRLRTVLKLAPVGSG